MSPWWPLPCPPPLLRGKIAKPQDYAKGQGCHPEPGGAEGRWGEGQVRFHHLRGPVGPAPSSLPLGWPVGILGGTPGWRQTVASWAGRPHPTPPSCRGSRGSLLPSRGRQADGLPGWVGSHPHFLSGPQTWGGGGAQGGGTGRGHREVSPPQLANCSACSTPQVTFHRGDGPAVPGGDGPKALPPQDSRRAPLQMSWQGAGWPAGSCPKLGWQRRRG